MEHLFEITLELKVGSNRTDGPTADEVFAAFLSKLMGEEVAALRVSTLDGPVFEGERWACLAINGEIKTR